MIRTDNSKVIAFLQQMIEEKNTRISKLEGGIEEIILMLQSNKASKVNSALDRLKQLKEEIQ